MPTPCDTLITARYCITQDEDRTVLESGAVAVSDGRIVAVGAAEDLNESYVPAERIAYPTGLLMPGLVNAHTHVPMTLFRGLADDLPLMQWLEQYIFPVEQHHTPDTVRAGALLGCAEMIRTGCTAFADMHFMSRNVFEAVDASGLRAVLGEAVFGFPTPAYGELDQALGLVRDMGAMCAKHDRISLGIAPHAVYTTSPELLEATFALAEEYDVPWMLHLAETPHETTTCLGRFGKRPLEYVDSLGLVNPRCLFMHCVDLTDEEIALLALRGAAVAHNPRSNMKLASGMAPVERMHQAGVRLGLGTDGPASNNALNMFQEMGFCALLGKVKDLDPSALPAQTVLDMATCGAADAIGLPETGRLVPGALADCTVLDTTSPNMQPLYEPVSQTVYAASGHEVVMTMVGGTILYRDGRFTTLDYPGLLGEIAAIQRWAWEQIQSKAGS